MSDVIYPILYFGLGLIFVVVLIKFRRNDVKEFVSYYCDNEPIFTGLVILCAWLLWIGVLIIFILYLIGKLLIEDLTTRD